MLFANILKHTFMPKPLEHSILQRTLENNTINSLGTSSFTIHCWFLIGSGYSVIFNYMFGKEYIVATLILITPLEIMCTSVLLKNYFVMYCTKTQGVGFCPKT